MSHCGDAHAIPSSRGNSFPIIGRGVGASIARFPHFGSDRTVEKSCRIQYS